MAGRSPVSSHPEHSLGYCQIGESRPNIVGLEDALSSISCGQLGHGALNLTVPG